MKNKIIKRGAALLLALIMTLPLLASCSVRKVPAGELALTPVGAVDGNTVLYEEIYYLASNYLPYLKAKYGEDTEGLKQALTNTVYENAVTNYAILALCKEAGVSVDERTLSENIQAEIDALVETECGGSRSDYRDMLKESGMTDHYMRETMRIDLLYSELPAKYAANGLIPAGEESIKAYVRENFICTKHIAILVENGESYEENKQKAEEALEAYNKGEYTTFNKLIGSKYNEDLSPLTSDNGYYSALGSMDKAYEEAALSLEINGVSGVIESVGQSNVTGDTVTAFYIIKRFEIDDAYVTANLTEMQDKCIDAIVAKKLEERKAELKFEPNEFGASLDLTSLEHPKDAFDFFVLVIVLICLAVCGLIALVVILVNRRRKKRIAARRAKMNLKQ